MSSIAVNADQWRSLSEQEQAQITQIMKSVGLLGENDFIEPSSESPPINTVEFPIPNPGEEICKIGCDVAQAAAVTACAAVPGGAIAIAICITAAQAVGDICRDNC